MYRSFFQLKDEPFRLTNDPRFLHLAEPHQAALKVVLEGILFRKGLVMVTGPIGTGKTTVIHTALRVISAKKTGITSALLFNPVLTREDRKSTRLNSSHVAISYAVFCLKKKTPPRSRPSRSTGRRPRRRGCASGPRCR